MRRRPSGLFVLNGFRRHHEHRFANGKSEKAQPKGFLDRKHHSHFQRVGLASAMQASSCDDYSNSPKDNLSHDNPILSASSVRTPHGSNKETSQSRLTLLFTNQFVKYNNHYIKLSHFLKIQSVKVSHSWRSNWKNTQPPISRKLHITEDATCYPVRNNRITRKKEKEARSHSSTFDDFRPNFGFYKPINSATETPTDVRLNNDHDLRELCDG